MYLLENCIADIKSLSKVSGIFEALSDPYHRQLLVAMLKKNTQDADDVDPLGVADYSAKDIDFLKIKMSLVHTHLSKMDEACLIRYNDTRQTVRLADQTDEVRAHLQTMASD